MATGDIHSLLIGGNAQHFGDDIERFQLFLLEELNFDPEKVRILLGKNGNVHVLEQTDSFFRDLKNDGHKAVILYRGHGGIGNFSPEDEVAYSQQHHGITYEQFGRLIRHNGNFIFINDCCYSGSAIKSFEEIGLLPKNGLVLASARPDEHSLGGVYLSHLTEAFRNGKVYGRRRIEGDGNLEYMRPVVDPRKVERPTVGYNKASEPMHIVQHPMRSGRTLDHLLFKDK